VESGYEVSYTPTAPGRYYVTVKYNGKNVTGSPFAVNVGGDNLEASGLQIVDGRQRRSSRSSMTMETLKRTSYIRHQYTEKRQTTSTTNSSSAFNTNTALTHHEQQQQQQRTVPVSDPMAVRCHGSGLTAAQMQR